MKEQKKETTINILLWVFQVFLALSFIAGAIIKLFWPADELAAMWPWTVDNRRLVHVTAFFDLLAGAGLVLPALLTIQPRLTIYAAYATIVLMLSAIVFHVARGEASQIGGNIFFLLSALLIAWGRTKKAPIDTKKTRI